MASTLNTPDDLLANCTIFSTLNTAYIADPARVRRCWQAYLAGDFRPLKQAITDLAS